jgi:hypothetical protein
MNTRPSAETIREAFVWFARHGMIKSKKLARKLSSLSGG